MDDINNGVKTLLYLLEQRLHQTGGDLQDVLHRLVDTGCLLHKDSPVGVSVLHSMIAKGHADEVRLLLAHGKPGLVNCVNQCGNLPLHVAVNTTHFEILRVLLECGAEVNCQRSIDKYAPMHVAALNGNVDATSCLLKAGADVRAANLFGNSALHLAAGIGHVEMLDILIAAGAPLESCNSRGNTPLANAARNDHSDVVEHLLKAGANPNVLYAQNHELLKVMMKECLPHVALHLVCYGATVPDLHTINNWLRPKMREPEMLVILALILSGNDSGTLTVNILLQEVQAKVRRLPPALRTWVNTQAGSPLQLNFLCRQRVRRLLLQTNPGPLSTAIHGLLLPAPVTNFLLLADLKFIKTPMRIVFRDEEISIPSTTPWLNYSPQLKLAIESET